MEAGDGAADKVRLRPIPLDRFWSFRNENVLGRLYGMVLAQC